MGLCLIFSTIIVCLITENNHQNRIAMHTRYSHKAYWWPTIYGEIFCSFLDADSQSIVNKATVSLVYSLHNFSLSMLKYFCGSFKGTLPTSQFLKYIS